MFYSHSLLSRSGPLANIWVAAFCLNKLKRDQIAATDISSSIDKLLPEIQISYRIMAQLLLGIVRIFSKKVDFLYHDCHEALTYITKSFQPSRRTISKRIAGKSPRNVKKQVGVKHVSLEAEVNSPKSIEAIRATSDRLAITRPKSFELDSFDLEMRNAAEAHQHPVQSIEAIRAASDLPSITIPTSFALDCFDLEICDERDAAEAHQQHSLPQDHCAGEQDHDLFVNERHYLKEAADNVELIPACFTPVHDILPPEMMDVDFETGGPFKSSSKRENLFRKSQNVDEHVGQESAPEVHPEKSTKVASLRPNESIIGEQGSPEASTLLQRKLSDGEKVEFNMKNITAVAPIEVVSKSKLLCGPEIVSPKVMVTTPAKKEWARMSKKRTLYDETIVLSNETLREVIHDASSLVCKRRKAPHTFLDAWKEQKISSLQQSFMDSLISHMSPMLQCVFHKPSSDHISIIPDNIPEGSNTMQNHPPSKIAVFDDPHHERGVEDLTARNYLQEPGINILYELKPKMPSPIQTTDAAMNSMDWELSINEEDIIENGSLWSTRTKVVMQHLRERFLNLNNHKQNLVSLSQILEGKTRKTCARFFYETLVLKGHGFVDINQDLPYGDMVIAPTLKFEGLRKDPPTNHGS